MKGRNHYTLIYRDKNLKLSRIQNDLVRKDQDYEHFIHFSHYPFINKGHKNIKISKKNP